VTPLHQHQHHHPPRSIKTTKAHTQGHGGAATRKTTTTATTMEELNIILQKTKDKSTQKEQDEVLIPRLNPSGPREL